jgi:hypothetical protein
MRGLEFVAEHDRPRGILDASRKLREERVLDVAGDERDDLGFLFSQCPRSAMG